MGMRAAIASRCIRTERPKTAEENEKQRIIDMQAAIDTAYCALASSAYVGGMTEREAQQKAMAALGPLVTQYMGVEGGV